MDRSPNDGAVPIFAPSGSLAVSQLGASAASRQGEGVRRATTRILASRRGKCPLIVPIVTALPLLALSAAGISVPAKVWRDPLALFSERSPGERGAALYNTKERQRARPGGRVRRGASRPHERVLAATRERPSAFNLFPDVPIDMGGVGPTAGATGLAPLSDLPSLASSGVGPAAGGLPGIGVPVGGVAPGIGTPGGGDQISSTPLPDIVVQPTDSVPPAVFPPTIDVGGTPAATAVPEPTTWLTMILGFAAIGFGMRRKQHQTTTYSPV